ncbi:hypothetical protein ACH3XW_7190 [Acanthocheilonema viteae]|uniref:Uncharacterized protein n=1 Tax=Acanthocheilonema viteae TaxID=6277 RepID=A0A498SKV3_ACAVI|nr:unnamed protein product [Acanthocheilonema viteae]
MLACLAYEEVYGSVANVETKVGQTVHLKFDKFIRNIDIELKCSESGIAYYRAIIKDGKITKYGARRFGNRITFIDGNLIIRDVNENDAIPYVYKLGHYSQKVRLILSH